MMFGLRTAGSPKIMQCSICEDPFSSPGAMTPKIITPCGHTFCQGCIGRLRPPVTCPTCRQKVVLPAGGAANLTTNFAVLGGTPERSGGGGGGAPLPPLPLPVDNCPKHDEALKWWCCSHSVPVCAHCIILKDHPEPQCDCKILREVAAEARKELGGGAGPVAAKAEALKAVVAQNKAKAAALKALGEAKKRDFRAAITVIKNAADARVRTFEAEVDAAVARGCAEMVGPMTAAAEAALKTVDAVVAEQRGLAQLSDKTVMQRKDALAWKRQAALAVNAEGLKAVAPNIKCALQPEEVVAAVSWCLPSPELVGVVPAVKISGAGVGHNVDGVVDGVYCPTGRLHNGKALFQQQQCDVLSESSNHVPKRRRVDPMGNAIYVPVRELWYNTNGQWMVSNTDDVEANQNTGWAYTTTTGLDHPSLALSWCVSTAGKWEAQPTVTCTPLYGGGDRDMDEGCWGWGNMEQNPFQSSGRGGCVGPPPGIWT
jgi:hypothetical protein